MLPELLNKSVTGGAYLQAQHWRRGIGLNERSQLRVAGELVWTGGRGAF